MAPARDQQWRYVSETEPQWRSCRRRWAATGDGSEAAGDRGDAATGDGEADPGGEADDGDKQEAATSTGERDRWRLQNEAIGTQVQHAGLGEKGTLILNFGFVYHVMNIACIHYDDSRSEYIHVQVL